ncbi:hypothetical protein VP01_1052g3 [Puccinia sorghi]|uniref:Uncharacterized protein n=1 Tax=Puccinia sorghi TaxID=27349 RepID=A0A0L6VUD3_9BASI|nr:hypothetical protein VP01_1052g3 [Puccinia sorghi]
MDTALVSNLQASLAERDAVIAQLMARVEAVELQSKKQSKKSPSAQTVSAGKKNASKAPVNSPQVTITPPARKISIPTFSSKKNPVKQRARSATPVSAKKSPLQMTKKDHPEGFKHTKNALYIHIKVLWGLIAQGSIPKPPSEEPLRSFYQRFRSTKEMLWNNPNAAVVPHCCGIPQILTHIFLQLLFKLNSISRIQFLNQVNNIATLINR